MYLLDTDHLSILERGGEIAQRIISRLAIAIFKQLRTEYPRLGTMDLKIAAIAISKSATLLTRNLSDFENIASLQVEDWTS